MLLSKPTPHGAGITLYGDYKDLQNLHETIHELCKEDGPLIGQMNEFVLAFAYDIRHAYQGNRDKLVLDGMLEMGNIASAEALVLTHAAQLNGDWYSAILPLAETFEQHERYLVSSIMHRALVNSILERAISKNYHHAVRYMRHLKLISKLVGSWQIFETHEDFVARLENLYARKSAFWGKMGVTK